MDQGKDGGNVIECGEESGKEKAEVGKAANIQRTLTSQTNHSEFLVLRRMDVK